MWRVAFIFVVAVCGFWFGYRKQEVPIKCSTALENIHPEKTYPVTEHKSFVFVIYAYNQAAWCERALASVFEQEYDHYRIIVVDDGSTDGTSEKAKQFISENNQDAKAIVICNEMKEGPVASLYRAVGTSLDREIIVPIDAKDSFCNPNALAQMNEAYQNPDVWISRAAGIEYPTYKPIGLVQNSFYSALFRQIHLKDLYKNGRFATDKEAYLTPLLSMSGGRICLIKEPMTFVNMSSPLSIEKSVSEFLEYEPLAEFPVLEKRIEKTDILIFSYDRPLQLYACLESIQRYITGFENLSVLYRFSSPKFDAGYAQLKEAFPNVRFIAQSADASKKDFKPHLLQIVYGSPSKYITFGVDDIIVKDFVDLNICMDQMDKTGAYGFYLCFGRHINKCCRSGSAQSLPPSAMLAEGIYAWDFQKGECDWGLPASIDLTLFKKDQIKEILTKMRYTYPASLESNWATKYPPTDAIGLYFESSKLVNILMNAVAPNGNSHMNYMNTNELLEKFNLGLKIDIEPLYQVENGSPDFDYLPEFTKR